MSGLEALSRFKSTASRQELEESFFALALIVAEHNAVNGKLDPQKLPDMDALDNILSEIVAELQAGAFVRRVCTAPVG